jgi:hypothetical protein
LNPPAKGAGFCGQDGPYTKALFELYSLYNAIPANEKNFVSENKGFYPFSESW